MLRRYLITNGISTALLYGGIYAAIPSIVHALGSVQDAFNGFVAQSPILAPLVNKIVVMVSSL
ncbi:hypothetical protein RLW55_11495 [Hyphomicrobium sp. B1]|jgi:hypothetical protein|uniref:hypothetical protein n=1 Tax=unclassified Hyphomicrobium TaxID=2619925 RepID=UPI00391A9EFD